MNICTFIELPTCLPTTKQYHAKELKNYADFNELFSEILCGLIPQRLNLHDCVDDDVDDISCWR